jgi:glycolate oxidase FAD binding subunit
MADSSLESSLESIVGSEHITRQPDLLVDSLKPLFIIRPASHLEVAECLRVCGEHSAAVIPAGKMTWLECGNPLRRADVVLSLERMNRVIEYSAPDLTATVEAGVLLADFNTLVRKQRQWLPLDPPNARCASVGAVFACASFGPLRAGFGTPRDYALGLKLAHIDGSESRSGGKVVKNVAGYDMNKLYVGSFGTLALITELTIKLRPLPDRISTLIITDDDRRKLLSVARAASELQPASLFLCSMPMSLAIRFAGSEPTIRYQTDCVMKALEGSQAKTLSEDEAESFWTRVADIDRAAAVAIKASAPVSRAAECFENMLSLPCKEVASDLGAGVSRAAFDAEDEQAVSAIEKLRAETWRMGGTLVIERASANVRKSADAWGEVETVGLMRAIKEKFDPRSLLNPGKFVAGI